MKTIWQLAFRPFFLIGSAFAAVFMVLWMMVFAGAIGIADGIPPGFWHGQQMIFGFVFPVIVGFLMTATQNWTGIPGVSGVPLQVLAVIWACARVLAWQDGDLVILSMTLDSAFMIYSAVLLWPYLKPPKYARNSLFLIVFAVVAAANCFSIFALIQGNPQQMQPALYLMINASILVIATIGGRVIPFFTERIIPEADVRPSPKLMKFGQLSLILFVFVDAFFPATILSFVVAMICVGTQGLTLSRWYDKRIWTVPILWILHVGYIWIVLGFIMKGAITFYPMMPSLPLHAFTVGGIGVVIYGMVSRVSLGHTGRDIVATKAIILGYLLLNFAVLVRCILPLVGVDYALCIDLSGGLWALAFLVLFFRHFVLWLAPRPDGKHG